MSSIFDRQTRKWVGKSGKNFKGVKIYAWFIEGESDP
jgi:hypothetical protein